MADTLNPGEWLRPGNKLQSQNNYHVLAMQEDGNLVLYSLGTAVWSSKTDGKPVDGLIMQDDGNLVIYGNGVATWSSGTAGRGKSRLVMQDDRNAVVYDGNNTATWNSETSTAPECWETVQIEMSPETHAALMQDENANPWIVVGVVCTSTPAGLIVCSVAAIAAALIVEFATGDPPFGPNSAPRVIGGKLEASRRKMGRDLSSYTKNQGKQISKTWKRWF